MTIEKKLQRSIMLFSAIVLTFLLLCLAVFGVWTYQVSRLAEQSHALHVVFTSVETSTVYVERCVLLGYAGMQEQAETKIEQLEHDAEELIRLANFQETRALHGMVDTFLKHAGEAVSCRLIDRKRAEAALEEMQYTTVLIRSQQDFMIRAMDEYTSEAKNELQQGLITQITAYIVLFAAFCGGCWIYWKRFARSFVSPVLAVQQAARKIAQGNLMVEPLTYSRDDELGDMSQDFNRMVELLGIQLEELWEKHSLEEKLYQEQIEHYRVAAKLKDSELRLLQARINPHFLFNTLNMILLTGQNEHAEKTTKMIRTLSAQLRYSLSNLDRVVTLQDELDHVQNYFDLSALRFQERLQFQIDADHTLDTLPVPALILQPLVENSILHGAKDNPNASIVGVSVRQIGDRAEITVYDDGRGMTRKKIDDLMNRIENNQESNAIGLYNVFTRLRLLYGERVEYSISSIPNNYTEVRICISLSAEKPEEQSGPAINT